jgi:hypothetical protein
MDTLRKLVLLLLWRRELYHRASPAELANRPSRNDRALGILFRCLVIRGRRRGEEQICNE